MADKDVVQVTCPCCRAVLTVDLPSGEVLMHKEVRTKPEVDLHKAAEALKEDAGRRRDVFQKSLQAEKNKGETLKKKFDEAMKRAKEEPDQPPPLRGIDLD